MSERKIVFFDLDGTLVDSLPDIRTALNALLQEQGRRALTLPEVQAGLGSGAAQLVLHGFRVTGQPAETDILPSLLEAYAGHYRRNLCVETTLYPGTRDMLKRLSEQGYVLGVCTNKTEHIAVRLLETLGLRSFFATITGGDTVLHRKPHGGHIQEALDRCRAAAQLPDDVPALMVGDSEFDVQAAKHAGLPILVVSFGYAGVPPEELGGDAVLTSFDLAEESIRMLL